MPLDILSEYTIEPRKLDILSEYTLDEAPQDLRGGLELPYPANLEPVLLEQKETPSASPMDLLRRLPAGISEAGAQAVAGLLKVAGEFGSMIPGDVANETNRPQYESLKSAIAQANEELAEKNRGVNDSLTLTNNQEEYVQRIAPIMSAMRKLEANPGNPVAAATDFMREVAERSRADYGVDPAKDSAFLSQVASSLGAVVPAIAAGPAAPAVIAGMMGESGRAEAEEFGATQEQQDKAFYANAAVGAVSEALLGVPALLRSVRAAKIPARTFEAMAKSAAFEAFKGGLREGTQEAIEQTAGNVIAKYIAEYDPTRPEEQGVWQSFLVGAATGAPVGAVVQAAQNLSAPPSGTFDVETGTITTPDGKVFTVDETGASEVVPGSPKSVSDSVLVPEKGAENAVQEQEADAQVLRPEEEGVGLQEMGPRDTVAEEAPAQAQPKIVSTGILTPEGIATGEGWNTKHADIIRTSDTVKLALAEGMDVDALDANKGFIVEENGKQRFVGRKEALEIARKSGQVDESVLFEPERQGLISEALIKPETAKAAEVEQPAQEPVEGPPGPPPEVPVGIPEDRGRTPLPTPTGPRNAVTEANRFLQGLGPRAEPIRRSAPEVLAEGMRLLANEPNMGTRLVNELNKEARALLPEELAVLAREQVVRENEYNAAIEAVNNATDEASRRSAERRLTDARDANQEAYSAFERSGTPAGQALAFRKLMLNKDYTLAGMEAEIRALKGGAPLDSKELGEIKQMYDGINKAAKKAKEMDAKQSELQAHEEYLNLAKIARRDNRLATKEGKGILDRIISNGESAAERIKKRRKSGRLMMSATIIDPVDFVDYVQVGAGYIAKGVKTLAEFTARLTSDFGEDVSPHSERIYTASQEFHNEATRGVPKTRSVVEAMSRDKAGSLDPQVVYDVARAHINEGVQGFEPVMQSTLASLKKNHPDLTMREVRDAFSGYGKVTRPSQAEDRVKLREYRRLAQLESAIEDAMRKITPMKSGPQRDKATEAVRSKMAELKRAMEENGIQVTSPEQQLANAEKAAVTRLQNSIESLERQIAEKKRDATTKGRKVDTPEIRDLQERVNSLKETLDEVAPKQKETPEQKEERAIKQLSKRIAELDEQLRQGRIGRREKITEPPSPRRERLQAERDAMLELITELRDKEAGTTPEQRKITSANKALDKQIEALDLELRTGERKAKKSDRVSTPEIEKKRAELAAMRELRKELNAMSRPKMTEEQRQIKAVKKAIQELDRQLREGDLAVKKVPRGTESTELESLRSERDSMRSLLQELRNESKVKRSPEEIALSRYKKTIATKTKQLRDRIDKGDYVRKKKKETELDKEALEARFEYQKAKDEFEKRAFEYDLSRRGTAQKVYDTALEVLNTSRSIMTSVDYSAPLRQGAFITLAHPIRSLKLFPKMFSASGLSPGAAREGVREVFRTGNPLKYFKAAGEHGEKMAYAIQESLSNPRERPNAALYRQSGLDLTETGPNTSRRKLEEAYQSRFASKIPIVAGSQRAYTSFLNLLRADSFDAMVKNLGKGGKVTEGEAKAIADFINIATGRGKYGQKMEQATQALNAVFFAPKYVASRFQLILNPLTGFSITGGSARVRAQVAKEYARFLIGAGVVLGLAKLAGADVEDDPRSSDFAKIKIGNTRLDPMGGLSQVSVLLARTATGKSKPTSGKGMMDLRNPKYGGQNIAGLWGTFARQKFSPIVSANFDAISGRDVVGNPVTPAGAYSRLVVPLQFGDVVDAMVEQGIPRASAMTLASIFGASMSTYETGKKRPKEAKEPWEALMEDLRDISEDPWTGKR